jgi:pimeloyl-ACP methyl ester carboxylesterase
MHDVTRRSFLAGTAASAGTIALLDIAPAAAQQTGMPATPLEVLVSGSGPRVVLVHGSNLDGPLTWAEQRPLAARWRLEIVNRRGYGNSPPPAVRQDFEEDARDIAALLGDGAHLVGHSFGAIGSLYAAALRPQAVRSLTINEPPVFGLLKGDPAAAAMAARADAIKRDIHEPRAFLEAFAKVVAGPEAPPPRPLPDPLPPELEKGIRTTMMGRDPGTADLSLGALKRTSFPKLVTSGGHHPVFEAICDRLQRELNAERAVIRGAGHGVPRTGAPFNERLEAFLQTA